MAALDPLRKLDKWGVYDPASEEAGFGKCLWNAESVKEFKVTPSSGATNPLDMLIKTKEKYGDRPAVGWRKLIKAHMVPDQGGVPREKLELENAYTWLTFAEYYERMLGLARGLSLRGVGAQSRVVLYAETQRDWMCTAFATWYCHAQVVTIYATLGEDGAVHGINETEATVIVTDAKLMKVLQKVLPQCKSVKCVVSMTALEDSVVSSLEELQVSVDSIDSLIEKGRSNAFSPSIPKPEDVAVIMYTSGTTGTPKGVMLTHGNITATAAYIEYELQGMCGCQDVYLAYLPLAHIMEMAAETAFFAIGGSIGFGGPQTLLSRGDASKKLYEGCIGDAPCLSPTIMVFPPAVLDKIYKGVTSQVSDAGFVARTVFQWGVNSGERRLERGLVGANRLYNALAFKKTQALVGGRVKGILSGSAPLSPEVHKFVQTIMHAPVRQGYGMTETTAAGSIAFWGDNALKQVGPPSVCACIRLADWPEGNYLNSDAKKEGVMMPRGEVLIGGPCVCQGYFVSKTNPNQELIQKNQEEFVTIQGIRFIRTGDVGQITDSGQLMIIDRKKDLWKGPNGEYVALTKVEQALSTCEYVVLPMCYGRTGRDYPIALVCPMKPRIEQLAQELQVEGEYDALCKNERIIARVSEACQAACRASKLVEFEIPKKFALISDLWTPENDMLTAAMKLKRAVIGEKHKDDIDRCYA